MYIASLIFSIWYSILFWDKNLGFSVALFILPFVCFLIKLLENKGRIKNKRAKLIAIPIILLSSTYCIFNNTTLRALNLLVIPTLIGVMVIEMLSDEFTLDKFIKKIIVTFIKPISYFGDVIKNTINQIRGKKIIEQKEEKNLKRTIKAIILTTPILLFVFILLVSADLQFAKAMLKIVSEIFEVMDGINISNAISRVIVIIFIFLYIGGFFTSVISNISLGKNIKEKSKKDNLTIKMILTTLNILYIVFCFIQIKSLYTLFTMNGDDINYAAQARQGFFQLMLVSAINLVMILISKEDKYLEQNSKYVKVMDFIMLILTTIILISSFIRMQVYQQVYGLTVRRVLVFFALITEGILIVPTAMYIENSKVKLQKIYFVTIVSMYVLLNFVNIDRLIAKTNIDKYIKEQNIKAADIYYLRDLSVDTTSQMIRLYEFEDISHYDRKDKVKRHLNSVKKELGETKTTIPEFNLSTYFAKKKLQKLELN